MDINDEQRFSILGILNALSSILCLPPVAITLKKSIYETLAQSLKLMSSVSYDIKFPKKMYMYVSKYKHLIRKKLDNLYTCIIHLTLYKYIISSTR